MGTGGNLFKLSLQSPSILFSIRTINHGIHIFKDLSLIVNLLLIVHPVNCNQLKQFQNVLDYVTVPIDQRVALSTEGSTMDGTAVSVGA